MLNTIKSTNHGKAQSGEKNSKRKILTATGGNYYTKFSF